MGAVRWTSDLDGYRERAAAAGFADRVCVHLLDYRQLPPFFKGAFDSFVSCKMVEATGLLSSHAARMGKAFRAEFTAQMAVHILNCWTNTSQSIVIDRICG
ncbi:hypothetical protein A0H81_05696 [Grifola frondosa]|uniref:Uncharacterized protein n=1 Tax=Grifola frondosa TaxID=5627 RepID=A0A1C7MCY1_GRIFR|nr:hypothetical protein A0H81_05696 [Grifola frondosa]